MPGVQNNGQNRPAPEVLEPCLDPFSPVLAVTATRTVAALRASKDVVVVVILPKAERYFNHQAMYVKTSRRTVGIHSTSLTLCERSIQQKHILLCGLGHVLAMSLDHVLPSNNILLHVFFFRTLNILVCTHTLLMC